MHPWCRSTTICNITDEELTNMKRRARNPITGKNELVPANMTYEQWYKKYVEGNPDAQLMEKKVRNLVQQIQSNSSNDLQANELGKDTCTKR